MEQNVKTLEALKDKLCNWKYYDVSIPNKTVCSLTNNPYMPVSI